MTSNINPSNIDGTYPIAGQDNNSQGFRDNFTNTKTNFQYAADEITDLQNKAILKSALTGTTLDNDMLGSALYNVELYDIAYTAVPLGTPSSSTITFDYSAGNYQTFTTSGAKTLGFSNFPAAGALGVLTVQITVSSTADTITFPSSVSVNAQGIRGYNPSTNTVTFATTGVYTFQFSTSNGGSTITVNETNKRLEPFNNSSEDLDNGGSSNLSLTTSYFSTSSAETATLAAGVNGQIKTLAMYADGGDMVITVTNAGWKSSGTGTITFNDIGDACTLQYINSKWFCIGNNGCSFA